MIFKSFLSLRSLYRDAEGNLLAGTMIKAYNGTTLLLPDVTWLDDGTLSFRH